MLPKCNSGIVAKYCNVNYTKLKGLSAIIIIGIIIVMTIGNIIRIKLKSVIKNNINWECADDESPRNGSRL